MTNMQKVERDIAQAPYYDANYQRILPGQLLMIAEGEPFVGIVSVVGENLCFDITPLDEILEVTENVYVVGWVQ